MRNLAQLFKALADETRLEILALILVAGEVCVCDVEDLLGITQSKSSRHLRYLRNAGLLRDRRAGAWVHYGLPEDGDPSRALVLGTLSQMIPPARLDDLRTRLAARSTAKNTCLPA